MFRDDEIRRVDPVDAEYSTCCFRSVHKVWLCVIDYFVIESCLHRKWHTQVTVNVIEQFLAVF